MSDLNNNSDPLIEYRVGQLEEAHKKMSETLTDLVFEIKSAKRLMVCVGILVGAAQPFVFHYLNK